MFGPDDWILKMIFCPLVNIRWQNGDFPVELELSKIPGLRLDSNGYSCSLPWMLESPCSSWITEHYPHSDVHALVSWKDAERERVYDNAQYTAQSLPVLSWHDDTYVWLTWRGYLTVRTFGWVSATTAGAIILYMHVCNFPITRAKREKWLNVHYNEWSTCIIITSQNSESCTWLTCTICKHLDQFTKSLRSKVICINRLSIQMLALEMLQG